MKVFSKTIKVGLTSDISDIKIGLKSGNSIEDFFIIAVVVRDAFLYNEIVVLRPKCRTKF